MPVDIAHTELAKAGGAAGWCRRRTHAHVRHGGLVATVCLAGSAHAARHRDAHLLLLELVVLVRVGGDIEVLHLALQLLELGG